MKKKMGDHDFIPRSLKKKQFLNIGIIKTYSASLVRFRYDYQVSVYATRSLKIRL